MHRRRSSTLVAAALVASVPGVAAAVPALAATPATVSAPAIASAPAASWSRADGDPDLTEVAIGVPDWRSGVGAVDALQWNEGHALVTRDSLGLGAGSAGDRFGAAVAVGDVNGDRLRDLVVGAPGRGGAGVAYLVLGGEDATAQSVRALPFTAAPGDSFGAAVRITHVAGSTDVWVSAPGRDVSGAADAGAVAHYRIPPAAASAVSVQQLGTLTQDTASVPGSVEAGDRFGEVLAVGESGHLLLGTPREDVGTATDAGTVTDLTASGTSGSVSAVAYTQDSTGVSGAVEPGDLFGAAIAGDYVGVPGEDIGSTRDAGMVERWTPGNPDRLLAAWSQDSPGVPGTSEAGDRFGSSVSVGYFRSILSQDVAAGAPGEDVGSVADAGSVTVVSADRNDDNQGLTQGEDLPGAPEAGDAVGASLDRFTEGVAGDDNIPNLVIGVPGEDIGTVADAGMVELSRLSASLPQHFTLSTGATTGAHYGTVVTAAYNPAG